jgi:hypothetical protein
MTHEEFIPYHNYHIRFRLTNGVEMSGVLTMNFKSHIEHKPDTLYEYIPTSNMIEWKQAEKDNDSKKKKILQGEIDISDIVWAERLRY